MSLFWPFKLLGGVGGSLIDTVQFLHTFSTDEAAGTRTSTADVGYLRIVDTNSIMPITSGELTADGSADANDGYFVSDVNGVGATFSQMAGRAFYWNIPDTINGNTNYRNGVSIIVSSDWIFRIQSGVFEVGLGVKIYKLFTFAGGAVQAIMIAADTAGYLLYIKLASGNWQLGMLYPEMAGNFYMYNWLNGTVNADVSRLAIVDSTLAPRSRLATQAIASPVATNALNHNANSFFDVEIATLPTSTNIISIEITIDALRVRVNASGDVAIDTSVDGVAWSEQSVSAGILSAGEKIAVMVSATRLEVYDATALRASYNTAIAAASGVIETVGDGALSDLYVYGIAVPQSVIDLVSEIEAL